MRAHPSQSCRRPGATRRGGGARLPARCRWVFVLLLLLVLPPLARPALARHRAPATPAARPPSSGRSPSWLSRHRHQLLWVTGRTAAAAAGLAAAWRREANATFADYERTADPQRIAALYDRTLVLDHRAGALFAVAEVAFVAAIYTGFFIKPAASDAPPRGGVADGGELAGSTASERSPAAPRCRWSLRAAPDGVALAWSW